MLPVVLVTLVALAATLSGCGGGDFSATVTTTTTTTTTSTTTSNSTPPAPVPKPGREVIKVPDWPDPKGFPLSFGIKANGMVYASGMQGMDFKTMKLVPGGVANETRQTLLNLQELLEAVKTSMAKVVACSVSLVNITRDFAEMNKAYLAFWPEGTAPPSRVTAEVAALAGKATVEIQCQAALAETEREAIMPTTPSPLPFSPAIGANHMVYVSGMQGVDMQTRKRVQGGVANETSQTLANIRDVLLKAGSSPDRVVACEVYLADLADFEAMNKAYAAFWPKKGALDGFPSRICVQAGLAGGASVEIRCLAAAASAPSRPKAVVVPGWASLEGFPLAMAVTAGGMVYASGLQGWNTTTMRLVKGGVAAETEQLLMNMDHLVKVAGSTMASVVGCEVSLRSMADFTAMNAAYAKFWPLAPPSRVAVQVGGLAGNASVEIKCTALLLASGEAAEAEPIPGVDIVV